MYGNSNRYMMIVISLHSQCYHIINYKHYLLHPLSPFILHPSSFSSMKLRLWLMFQPRLVTQPIVYELGKKFEIITNIRQASTNEEIGLVSVELEGERPEIDRAISWMEEIGVKVEPVEINTIEG